MDLLFVCKTSINLIHYLFSTGGKQEVNLINTLFEADCIGHFCIKSFIHRYCGRDVPVVLIQTKPQGGYMTGNDCIPASTETAAGGIGCSVSHEIQYIAGRVGQKILSGKHVMPADSIDFFIESRMDKFHTIPLFNSFSTHNKCAAYIICQVDRETLPGAYQAVFYIG